jgi:pyruvate formate lyase activating enzyme
MKRRRFIGTTAAGGLALGCGWPSFCSDMAEFGSSQPLSTVEARYYRKLPDRETECLLCPRLCKLGDKERGYCGVRENQGGTYYTLVYGKVCSLNVDPVEKKPFFHVLPASNALSLATAGCNVNCKFCQNWQISQVRPEQVKAMDLAPAAAVRMARKYRCPSIAYTYTEPVVYFEYLVDTAREAAGEGLRNLVVTAAHIQPDPLRELIRAVDAIKIDLKGFTKKFYAEYVHGDLAAVLEAIKTVAKSSVWLEIVYLVIPTLNDDPGEIREMSRWLKAEAGPDVPLHFSRFQPMYLVKNLPPTPVSSLETARTIALEEGLRYVYIGNVPGHVGENTYCPGCRRILIRRMGYQVLDNGIKGGKCGSCGTRIPGVWT